MPPPRPINAVSSDPQDDRLVPLGPGLEGDVVVLAFSGGGARAAAFSLGVMEGLSEMPARSGGSIADQVVLATGASGGAFPAAWIGIHGLADFGAFRAAVLDIDWHDTLHTSILSPFNLIRLYGGGANNPDTFADELDKTIFKGAVLGDFGTSGRPNVVLSATDIANHVPFFFGPAAFSQLCTAGSDIRVADAVAASMAAPVLFRPVAVEAFASGCVAEPPDWVGETLNAPDAPQALGRLARAFEAYRDPSRIAFVHLLDGGLGDYFALGALLSARQAAASPFEPLDPADAVRLTSLTIVVVNVGQDPVDDWPLHKDGPDGRATIEAAFAGSMSAGMHATYDLLQAEVKAWEQALRSWRCSLSKSDVRRLRGTTAGWRCGDIRLALGSISFTDLPSGQRDSLSTIRTRMSLPADQVELLISGGHAAALASPVLNALSTAH